MKTGYQIYSEWCRERGQVPCTREFFYRENNSLLRWAARDTRDRREIDADQHEIDRERQEGWEYDER